MQPDRNAVVRTVKSERRCTTWELGYKMIIINATHKPDPIYGKVRHTLGLVNQTF